MAQSARTVQPPQDVTAEDTSPASAEVDISAPDAPHPSAATDSPAPPSLVISPSGQPARSPISRENLEQEVGQVLGTLSSWWGGVKKQSATALTSLKADLDKTVTQAQADFEQLRTAKVEVVRKTPEEFAAEQQAASERKASQTQHASEGETPSESLLDRITSSTTQLQHNLQTTFQTTLAAAASNPAIANASDLTSHLAENLRLSSAKQNLQLSVKQAEKLAEEYLQKGGKWVSEAVKVVPPGDAAGGSGMSLDGTDWYSMIIQPAQPLEGVVSPNNKPSRSTSTRALAGSRKDALLARLREDKDLVMVDPASESTPPEQRQRYERWVSAKWPAQKESAMATEGGMAGAVRMAVVPEYMTDEQFWQRYLYIRDTILEEDEKRQQLLKAHEQAAQPDDFTWDDETEESNTEEPNGPPTPKSKAVERLPAVPDVLPKAMPSTATSPRNSSEESYDVVSDIARAPELETEGKAKSRRAVGTEEEDDTSADSDWE